MSRFERWIYVVLAVVVLVWPGVRRQFFLQIRQITHTTDVRVGAWPKFSTIYEYALPVPANKLKRVAAKHKEWEGLAELLNTQGRYGDRPDTAAVAGAFDKALAANPDSRVVHARSYAQHMRHVDFYRSEERAVQEKRLGSKLGPYPAGISEKQAQPALDWVFAGQKLDPQNSLYDYGLAIIYIGMWKDDLAVASLNRGWRKPEYNTYRKEASLSVRQLLMEAGVPSLEATLNPVSSFSQLARMRRLAQNLGVIARKAESNGDWKRGWELRMAAFRMGNQLISGGQDYVVPLVGLAVQSIAIGNLPRTADQAKQLARTVKNPVAQERVRVQIVRDYAAKHQLGAEGEWVVAQYMAGQEFRRLYREMVEKDSGRYYAFLGSMLMWYGTASLLVVLLVVLATLGILSVPRTIRTAQSDRFAKIIGVAGAGVIVLGFFGISCYALRDWSNNPTPIPAWLTWTSIALLPALIIIFGLIRRSLSSIRTSARYALPVIAIAYVVLSGYLAIERSALERRALQSGLEPKQIEILKKTGFRK
ncbi:MAG TPA: hypothetical protein VFI02_05335 [Armatimonadota bacterium]|nr:hypothetical protein [Armatimonadota bacterium]